MYRWTAPAPGKSARRTYTLAIVTLCLAALLCHFFCWWQFYLFIIRYREPLLLWCLP
ncbi:MAG: hypothetical protein GX200_00960 [Firmicutes bacterium]|nr:hypothetical protein [Bacillota bacterium]